jgi:hypothetical protein
MTSFLVLKNIVLSRESFRVTLAGSDGATIGL